MASCSSRLKRDVQKLCGCFPVLQAFGNDPKRQRLNAGNGFIAVDAVAHDAGQGRHFRQPTAVLFALKLDGKNHGRNVASGPSNLQMEPARRTRCAIMSSWGAAHWNVRQQNEHGSCCRCGWTSLANADSRTNPANWAIT